MLIHSHLMVCILGLGILLNACQASDPSKLQADSGRYNCQAVPVCDAKAPDPGELRPFLGKKPVGTAWHRGHDQYFKVGTPQWVIAKFSYGSLLGRRDLLAEEVDIYLERGCGETWEKLGTALSTRGGGPSIEGIPDDGGRIYFQIPPSKTLGIGRHRLRLVVAGDHSATELFIEVLPADVPLFVSDVDGTLTIAELAELGATGTGKQPEANQGAAEALQALTGKGFRPVYITARPEYSVQRTRDFIDQREFPAGRIETSLAKILGLSGETAIAYKSAALKRLIEKEFKIAFAFGNTEVDTNTYENAGIPVESRYFFKYNDKKFGGQTINSYLDLNNFADVESLCE